MLAESNYSKVVVLGDVGAGKTTLIRTLSEIKPIDTDRKSSIEIGKEKTTVGIDYGRIHISDSHAIGLYGVPGQRRFIPLWQTVTKGVWGAIILKRFGSSAESDDIFDILNLLSEYMQNVPLVVGLTHVESAQPEQLEALASTIGNALGELGYLNTVITLDCRDRRSSLTPLVVLDALQSP